MKITIRLRPEKDDDIREWYMSLPSGDRSKVIRDALKDFIHNRKEINPAYISNRDIGSIEVKKLKLDLKSTASDVNSDEDIGSKLNNLLNQID